MARSRSPEEVYELNLSASVWSEDKEELEVECDGMGALQPLLQLSPRLQQPQQQRRGRAIVLTTDMQHQCPGATFLPLLKSNHPLQELYI